MRVLMQEARMAGKAKVARQRAAQPKITWRKEMMWDDYLEKKGDIPT